MLLASTVILGGDLTITSHVSGKGRFAREGTLVQHVDTTLSLDPSLQFPIRDYAKAMRMMNRMPGGMGALPAGCKDVDGGKEMKESMKDHH
jgi:hypothetical protein